MFDLFSDIFISYHWEDSSSAMKARDRMASLNGTQFTDPRRVARDINKAISNNSEGTKKTWLDIENLANDANTTNGESNVNGSNDNNRNSRGGGTVGKSVYEQHALAIKQYRVFMAFISDRYANSMFCRMQFQFACGLPNKIVIPVIVGSGDSSRDGGDVCNPTSSDRSGVGTPAWKSSIVGMSIDADKERFKMFDLTKVTSESDYDRLIQQIIEATK